LPDQYRNHDRGDPDRIPRELRSFLLRLRAGAGRLFGHHRAPDGLVWWGAVLLLALWGASGLYRVQPDEQGLELLFGRHVETTQPGLHFRFPYPIGGLIRPQVTLIRQTSIGVKSEANSAGAALQESLMLSGDQNIVDIELVVQWRIRDAAEFTFNMRDPATTVKIAAESTLRELVGRSTLQSVITDQRAAIAEQSRELLQQTLDGYGAGILILGLHIQKASPPGEVIDAFNEVQRARQDQQRLENEAQAYRNDILPRARGDAARAVQAAVADQGKLVREAEGEAARYTAFYQTYAANKEITARRLYIETMQDVLSRANTIIIQKNSGVVPYLRLPGGGERPRAPAAPAESVDSKPNLP
jgi:membrane protease subunit HflK